MTDLLPRVIRSGKPSLLYAVIVIGTAAVPASASDVREIELRRLMEPTPAERAQEDRGQIYIYDGLRDTDIQHAMDEEFHRIEHMMFIRTHKTDPHGEVKRDASTGEALIEDDGC